MSNKVLLESQEFENILVLTIATAQGLTSYHYDVLEQDIKSLIQLIDDELKG